MQVKYHSLYGQLLERQNFLDAWEKVKQNKGAGGADRQSVEAFAENWGANLTALWEECKTSQVLNVHQNPHRFQVSHPSLSSDC